MRHGSFDDGMKLNDILVSPNTGWLCFLYPEEGASAENFGAAINKVSESYTVRSFASIKEDTLYGYREAIGDFSVISASLLLLCALIIACVNLYTEKYTRKIYSIYFACGATLGECVLIEAIKGFTVILLPYLTGTVLFLAVFPTLNTSVSFDSVMFSWISFAFLFVTMAAVYLISTGIYLLHLLGCLDKPTGGNYYLDGKKVDYSDLKATARIRGDKIGFVFQNYGMIGDRSVYDNVTVPLVFASKSLKKENAHINEVLQSLGIGKLKNKICDTLSGGERQRCAIARALINYPDIMLADEPTGALDSKSGKACIEMLKTVNRRGGDGDYRHS